MISLNIDMPDKCCDCPCFYDSIVCNAENKVFTDEEREITLKDRVKWCPLIEIKETRKE